MTKLERLQVAATIIRKLTGKRAAEGSRACQPPIPNPWGFDGVDKVTPNATKYRARIRVCDALSGCDSRVTLGSFPDAHSAGQAYAMAHVALWGSLSRYCADMSDEELSLLRTRK